MQNDPNGAASEAVSDSNKPSMLQRVGTLHAALRHVGDLASVASDLAVDELRTNEARKEYRILVGAGDRIVSLLRGIEAICNVEQEDVR